MSRHPARRPEVLAQWSRAAMPAQFSAADAGRRERIVRAMAEMMARMTAKQRNRRRIRAMTFAVAATISAGCLLIFVVLLGRGNSGVLGRSHAGAAAARVVVPVGEGSAPPSAPSGSSALTAIVRAPALAVHEESSSRLHLSSGVEVAMGRDTRLFPLSGEQSQSDREELVLDLGFIHVDVPKLPRGHTFEVRTPDTRVTVHGTSFSVEVTRSGPSAVPVTRVVVSSGVVTVRHAESELLVGAGMEWASSDEVSPRAKPRRDPALSRSAQRRAREPTASPSVAPSTSAGASVAEPTTAETDLAEQNRLFGGAMSARERGDVTGAVRALEALVGRYPASPLAQDAYVERFRMLAKMSDHAAAARAARAYLTLYQDGFAREEARALALETGR